MNPPYRLLRQLCRLYGVQRAYYDINRRRRQASPEALIAILRALGAPLNGLQDVPAALRERNQARWQQPLEPVAVAWEGRPLTLELRLPDTLAQGPLRGGLTQESGEVQPMRWAASELPDLAGGEVEGIRYLVKGLPLPPGLPYGYHRLTLEIQDRPIQSLVISAPLRACSPPQDGCWGVFLPLYSIHTQRSWGAGDLSDLEALLKWAGELGARVLATLPLLPTFLSDSQKVLRLFGSTGEPSPQSNPGVPRNPENIGISWDGLSQPFDPSPYAPVSRRLWNELYVDLTRAPEFSPDLQSQIEAPAFQQKVQALRSSPLVDYRQQMALKRPMLEELCRRCLSEPSQREPLLRFAQANPLVADYARFRAVGEKQGTPWPAWPQPLRDGTVKDGDYSADARDYHLYVQWLAHQQVQQLSQKAREGGMELYFDLPLGVHPDGYDVWRERELFASGVSAGAPPDTFFPKGQDWGFPPLHPERLRQQGYRYYIDCLRHHLRYAGVLRIDHVMGFHRLFWVPRGLEARDGVYVRYPAEEFYAILTLESHRHQALIVGEDLGTVPPEVRPAMGRHGLLRSYVAQFEMSPHPHQALASPRPYMVASLNTHDAPPFAAFWEGLDIQRRQEMGLWGDAEARQERERRGALKQALGRFMQHQGWAKEGWGEALDALKALLAFLSASPAKLFLVNLEDLWLENRPQNLPGTGQEEPNWRRKARYSLEEFSQSPQVMTALHAVNRAREGQGPGPRAVEESPPAAPPATTPRVRYDVSLLTEEDLYLFNEGTHHRLYLKLGAHPLKSQGEEGTYFALWAPDAERVSVIGDFNRWDKASHPLHPRGRSGIYEGFIPGIGKGARYKYHLVSRHRGYRVDKADPFAHYTETPPGTASIIWDWDYPWGDGDWMAQRHQPNALKAPMAIYEVHLGSWRRVPEEGQRPPSYRELAPLLAEYVLEMGFTHVEFLPVMEHPFYGSWGYQISGYFAPTSRYGSPQDLMFLIDYLHQQGIGVILDWVPSHFPRDEHGLAFFDGTHLYEHADPRQGWHPDWDSFVFNYGRNEVRSFLISNALFYLDKFHADGLRLDAVASMLYLDYSRKEGQWLPNRFGGRENLEAIDFLRCLNEAVYKHYPDVQTVAEESSAWPMVSRPAHIGGLGFGLKWDMGWMHDTLEYMARDSLFRKYHHHQLTFRQVYAHNENFVLPLSHDEVVHGKGSLLGRMPGDDWQKFANLRLLLGYMFAQPGKKLLFMGGEFGQWREWCHDHSLDWHLLSYPAHQGVQRWVQDLNRLYRQEPALYELDFEPAGFQWVDCNDSDNSVLIFLRQGHSTGEPILICANFTPVPRWDYQVGVPYGGLWQETLNSNALKYGGSGIGNYGGLEASPTPSHGRPYSLSLTLPPLGLLFLKRQAGP